MGRVDPDEAGRLTQEDVTDFAELGVSIEIGAGAKIQPFGIWPDHQEAVQLFLDLDTAWRESVPAPGYRVRLGIDWSQAVAFHSVPLGRELTSQIKIMEAAALQVLNAGN